MNQDMLNIIIVIIMFGIFFIRFLSQIILPIILGIFLILMYVQNLKKYKKAEREKEPNVIFPLLSSFCFL